MKGGGASVQPTRLSKALRVALCLVVGAATAEAAGAAPAFQLSGTVRYAGNSSRPVPATALKLQDAFGNETVTYTDVAGSYTFDSFGSLDGWATPWTLTPQRLLRYEETGNTLSALDAAYALQMAVGIRSSPTGIARVGCDVTGDGAVSSLDAARILQNSVGIDVPLARCGGEWAFAPTEASGTNATLVGYDASSCSAGRAEFETAGGSLPNATVDFAGAAFGDCSGNWIPSSRPAPWGQVLGPPPGSHYSYGATTRAIAADAQGNLIAVGDTDGEVDIAGTSFDDPHGIFIAKFTKSGESLWSVVWPRPSNGSVDGVATDPSGDIVITGVQSGETFYGNGQIIAPDGVKQVYVAKLRGQNGSVVWAQAFGSAAQEQPGGIAVTGAGDVVVGIGFSGTLNVGGGDRVASGPWDGLLMALSSGGQLLWDLPLQGSGANGVSAVFALASRIVVGGWFSETLEATSTLVSAGGYDAFILELDADGVMLNSVRLGGAGYEDVKGIARKADGELAVVGSTSGTDFPEPKPVATPEDDAFVVVLSDTGTTLWGRRLGAGYGDAGYALAFDPEGDVIVGGRFGSTVDFGGVSLTSLGQHDGFLAKYAGSDGALQWAERIGGSGLFDSDSVRAVTATDQGIYVGGQLNTEYTWTGLNEGFSGNRSAFVRRFDP